MNKPTNIRYGQSSTMPAAGTSVGELKFTLDTKCLYFDNGTENLLIGVLNPINADNLSQILSGTNPISVSNNAVSLRISSRANNSLTIENDGLYSSNVLPDIQRILDNYLLKEENPIKTWVTGYTPVISQNGLSFTYTSDSAIYYGDSVITMYYYGLDSITKTLDPFTDFGDPGSYLELDNQSSSQFLEVFAIVSKDTENPVFDIVTAKKNAFSYDASIVKIDTVDPSTSDYEEGDVYYNAGNNNLYRLENSTWISIGTPSAGQVYLNQDNNVLYRSDGSQLVRISVDIPQGFDFIKVGELLVDLPNKKIFDSYEYEQQVLNGYNFYNEFTVLSDTAPLVADYSEGDIYFNTTDNKFYKLVNSNWVFNGLPVKDKIYIELENNYIYRCDGTTLIQIGGSSTGTSMVNTDVFTLLAGQSSINTHIDLSDKQVILVEVNGLGQILNADYSISTTSGESTIIFTTTYASNSSVSITYLSNISIITVEEATSSVKGIMKLYTTTGNNSDGTITQSEITRLLGLKQDALSSSQLNAVNSGITSSKVTIYDGYALGKQDAFTVGDGLDLTNSILSVKGIQYLADQYDIDNLKTDGVYLIWRPTGTLPTLQTSNSGIFGSGLSWYCLIKVSHVEIESDTKIIQDAKFIIYAQTPGILYGNKVWEFTRLFQTPFIGGWEPWQSLGDIVSYKETYFSSSWSPSTGETTIYPVNPSNFVGNSYYDLINRVNAEYSIDSLTLNNIEDTSSPIIVDFKTSSSFTGIVSQQLQYRWIGYTEATPTLKPNHKYRITIIDLYAKLESLDDSDLLLEKKLDVINITSLTSDQSSYTLSTNNEYTMSLSSSVASLSLTLNTPSDATKSNSILVHAYIGNASMTISWGTTHFIDGQVPSIAASGYYDIMFVYNPLLSDWVCRLVLIEED